MWKCLPAKYVINNPLTHTQRNQEICNGKFIQRTLSASLYHVINWPFQCLTEYTRFYSSQFRITWISQHFSSTPTLGVSLKANFLSGSILKFSIYYTLYVLYNNLHINFTQIRGFWKVAVSLLCPAFSLFSHSPGLGQRGRGGGLWVLNAKN